MGIGDGGCNITIWSFVWLILLIFLGWPIAWFLVGLYILIQPFIPCISALQECSDLLFKVVKLPQTCAEGIVSGKSLGSK